MTCELQVEPECDQHVIDVFRDLVEWRRIDLFGLKLGRGGPNAGVSGSEVGVPGREDARAAFSNVLRGMAVGYDPVC